MSPVPARRLPSLSAADGLVVLVAVLYLVPIWSVGHLPTQDGPSHLHNARNLAVFDDPGAAILREYLEPTPGFVPTWLAHRVLGGLQEFLAAPAAEKVIASGYVLLLPLAMLFALRSVRRDAGYLALLAFPLVPSFPFHMGFYPFCWSIAVYLLVLGAWLRVQPRRGPGTLAGIALLGGVLYLAHLFSLLMLVGGLGVLCLWAVALRAAGVREPAGPGAGIWPSVDRGSLLSLAAFVPALVPVAVFVAGQGGEVFYESGLADRAGALARLSAVVSYGWPERIAGRLTVGLLLVLVVLALAARRPAPRPRPADGLLVVAAAYVVVYFAAPDAMSNGAFIPERVMLFVALALVLWLGGHAYPPRVRGAVVVAGAALAIGVLAIHWHTYRTLDGYLDEYLATAAGVEPGATVLVLSLDHAGAPPGGPPRTLRVRPFLHAAEWVAAEKRIVMFPNYQPATGYFPLRWRPGANPYATIGFMEAEPPLVDFATYHERTGRRLDYVLLWGAGPGEDEHPAVQSIYRQLETGWDLVFTSPGRGLARLYRRR